MVVHSRMGRKTGLRIADASGTRKQIGRTASASHFIELMEPRLFLDGTHPLVGIGVPVDGQVSSSSPAAVCEFRIATARRLVFQLDTAAADDRNEVFIRRGAVPTLSTYDYVIRDANRSDLVYELASAQAATYYVMVHCVTDAWPSNENRYTLKVDDDTTIPLLGVGAAPVSGQLSNAQQFALYRMDLASTKRLVFQLDTAAVNDRNEIFIRRGSVPTLSTYDHVIRDANQSDLAYEVASAAPGTYYVLLHCVTDAWPSWDNGYTLRAEPVQVLSSAGVTKASLAADGTDCYAIPQQLGPLYVFLDAKETDGLKLSVRGGMLPDTELLAYDAIGSTGVVIPDASKARQYLLVTGATGGSSYSLSIASSIPVLDPAGRTWGTVKPGGQDLFYRLVLPKSGTAIVSMTADLGANDRLIAQSGKLPDAKAPQMTATRINDRDSVVYLKGKAGETWYLMFDNDNTAGGTCKLASQVSVPQLRAGKATRAGIQAKGYRVFEMTKPTSGPAYLYVNDSSAGADLGLYLSSSGLPGPDDWQTFGMAGMGATSTAILSNFEEDHFYVTVVSNKAKDSSLVIGLTGEAPATKLAARSKDAVRLSSRSPSAQLRNSKGQVVNLTYDGPGAVAILQADPGTPGATRKGRDIKTIVVFDDPGVGELSIQSPSTLKLGSLFSDTSWLKSLTIDAPELVGDVWMNGKIGSISATGDLSGRQFFAKAESLEVGGKLASDIAFAQMPRSITLKGDLAGSIGGGGSTQAFIGGNLSGRIDIDGLIDLTVRHALDGVVTAKQAGKLSFASITPKGAAVIQEKIGSIVLTQKRGKWDGSILAGGNISTVSAPRSSLNGLLYTDKSIGQIKLADIGTGVVRAGKLDRLDLGLRGMRSGVIEAVNYLDKLVSAGPINGTIISPAGMSLLQAPAIDHMSLFSKKTILDLDLGSGPLTADGLFLTGRSLKLPKNLDFNGTQKYLADLDPIGARNLVRTYANRIGVPSTSTLRSALDDKLTSLATDLAPAFGKTWNMDAFNSRPLRWLDRNALLQYGPDDAAFDMGSLGLTELYFDLFNDNLAFGAGTIYSLIKGTMDISKLAKPQPSLGNFIHAVTAIPNLVGGVTSLVTAMQNGGLMAFGNTTLATSLGVASSFLSMLTTATAATTGAVLAVEMNIIQDQFKLQNNMLRESMRSLTTGKDSYALNALDHYQVYNDNLSKALNPDIAANYTLNTGKVNWDSYYADTAGSYSCNYGGNIIATYASPNISSFGSFNSIGSIGGIGHI